MRRHPDDAPVAAGNGHHVANRLRVHTADWGIERHRPEDLESGRGVLAHEVRESGGLGPMVLQHESSQAALLCQSRDLEGVGLPRIAVGIVMGMQVDGTNDCQIGQTLVRLWRGCLPPVPFPMRLIAFRWRLLRRE
jgi:hypothetical protein